MTPGQYRKCRKPQLCVRFDSDKHPPFCYNIQTFQSIQRSDSDETASFWAWGAVICMIMVMVTGYKRK